jgi:hypothetical protein
LVVSAAGRAERESFSDFADGPVAPSQAGKALRAGSGEQILFDRTAGSQI